MTSPDNPETEIDHEALLAAIDQAAGLAGAQRERWLQALSERDPALAGRVRGMLASADSLEQLDHGPALLAEHLTSTHGGLQPGTRLGSWKVVEQIGHGGMGRVYLAERADGAFEMQVAIKVMRRERALPDAVIEHERALLARLQHPALTRLLDGGISSDGDVFLVMEHVGGQQLDDWCLQHDPDADARLDLFEQILDAVAHAHRQLIVHGDIKPGNVMVEETRRVRLLDFGIARLLASDRHAQPRALTPDWAAPECEAGEPPDVASDIHNLGRLLDHLLHPPCAPGDVRVGRLQADLAAIIDRATRDDPAARYADVSSLREDLRRYRRRLPVLARNGGRLYRLQRFARRHWLGAGFSAILLAVLLTAALLFAWQDRQVRSERDHARVAAARTQTVLDYLLGILGRAGQGADAKPVPVRKLLNDSLARIDTDFHGDKAARLSLLGRLGDLLVRLNDFPSAGRLLERFEAEADADTPAQLRARVLDNLSVVRMHQGKLKEARALSERAGALLDRIAADHRGQRSELLVTRAQILTRQGHPERAIDTLHQALSLRLAVSPPDAAQTVVIRNSLAAALMHSGQLAEALEQFRQIDAALRTSNRQNSLDAANIYNNYASTAFAYGRYQEAERLFGLALDLQRELYGPSAAMAALLNNKGKLELALGKLDHGRQHIHSAVSMMRQYAGADSVDLQLIRLSLGDVALADGDPDRARDLYRDIGARLQAKLGPAHPFIARVHALELIARAHGDPLAADDRAFDRMLATLAASPANARPHARLLCERAELALAQKLDSLAARSAGQCLELRRHNQARRSPPRLLAAYLVATARQHMEGSDTADRQRTLALARLADSLGEANPRLRTLREL